MPVPSPRRVADSEKYLRWGWVLPSWAAQRGCGVSILGVLLGDLQEPSERGPGQPALGGPADGLQSYPPTSTTLWNLAARVWEAVEFCSDAGK